MPIICAECKENIIRTANSPSSIDCEICKQLFHLSCVGVTLEEINDLKGIWRCNKCAMDSSSQLGNESHLGDADASVGDLNVDPNLKSIAKSLNDIIRSLNVAHEKLDSHSHRFVDLDSKLLSALEEVKELQESKRALERENIALRRRIDDLEQSSLEKSLEIRGVPETQGENLMSVISDVMQKLGTNIKPEHINKAYRYGSKQKRDRCILVDFVRKGDRDEVIRERRVRRDFKINNQLTFINEALTPNNRKLFALARAAKKNAPGFKYLWVRDGRILARKNDDSLIFRVSSEDDVNKII